MKDPQRRKVYDMTGDDQGIYFLLGPQEQGGNGFGGFGGFGGMGGINI